MSSFGPTPQIHLYRCLTILAAIGWAATAATGQATPENTDTEPATGLEQQLATVEASTTLPDEVKTAAIELYTQAIAQEKEAARWSEQREQLNRLIDSAPEQIRQIREQLAEPIEPSPDLSQQTAGMTTEQVELSLREAQQKLVGATEQLEKCKQQLSDQRSRPEQIQLRIKAARDELDQIKTDKQIKSAADEPAELTQARDASFEALERARQSEIAALERELAGQELLLNLWTARRDEAARAVSAEEEVVASWRQMAQKRREAATEQAAREAERAQRQAERAKLPPPIQAIADENVQLARRMKEATSAEAESAEQLRQVQERLERLEHLFSRAKIRIRASGLDKANGVLLRRMHDGLPNAAILLDHSRSLSAKIGRAEADRIDAEDQRQELTQLDDRVAQIIDQIDLRDEAQRARLAEAARGLLNDQRKILDQLQSVYTRQSDRLSKLNDAEISLASSTREFEQFIRQRLLWAQSTDPISMGDFTGEFDRPLRDRTNWAQFFHEIGRAWRSETPLWGFAIVVTLLLALAWWRTPHWLALIAARVRNPETDRFWLTVAALAVTCVRGAALPLMLVFFCYRVMAQHDIPEFTHVIAAGMIVALFWIALLATLRAACRDDGLAQVHFNRPDAARKQLRRHLLWLLWTAPVLLMLIGWVEEHNSDLYRRTTGRPAFILLGLIMAAFVAVVFRPNGGICLAVREAAPRGPLARGWLALYALLVGLPLVFMGLAAAGFYYTALFIDKRFTWTALLLLGIVSVHEWIERWLRVQDRRLMDQATEGDDQPPDRTKRVARVQSHNRAALHAVIGITMIVVLFLIWRPILPALELVNDVKLWSYAVTIDGEPVTQWVTIGGVGFSILLAVVTILAARNIPGVLEVTLLSRLPIDYGARYAITTISRYLIIGVGVVVVFQNLGLHWSRLQWLIAALGVGLGFGLQEIVANFVSGLIVLLERPFRVGDLVTIGNLTGRVTRINIRATTVTNWDRQESIIPNKDFITGQVINWSLSDPITRVSLPVVIAHEADSNKAKQLMTEAANEHALVLDDPEPSVLLDSVTENGLKLELRMFVAELADRIVVKHDLNTAIVERFRKAGIKLAYPRLPTIGQG